MVYVRAVDGDPAASPPALDWARYAHRAAQQLHGGDLEILQDGAEVLAKALEQHQAPADETAAACREVVHYARERGDLATAAGWQNGLATLLHTDGQCAAAAADAVASVHACPQHPATDAFIVVAQAFLLLDVCHRHEEASAVAAQLRVTDLPAEVPLTDYLDVIERHSPALHSHTAQFHSGEPCELTGCGAPADDGTDADAVPVAVPRTSAVGVADSGAGEGGEAAGTRSPSIACRLYEGLLTGFDPAHVPPHGPLAEIAERYAKFAGPQAGATALAWARYAHRTWLAMLDQDAVVAVTDTHAEALRRHGHPDAAVTAWRAAVQHAADRDDQDAVDIRRAKLAEVLYTDGRCAEGLDEIHAVFSTWQRRHPEPSTVSIGLAVQAAYMHGGCHRHDEVARYGGQIRIDGLPDRPEQVQVLGLVGYFADQAQQHTRAYHADDSCDDPTCLTALAAAEADAAAGAAGPLAGVREAGEAALALLAEQRFADASQPLAVCVAGFDPAAVTPDGDLVAVAAMYAFTTISEPGVAPSQLAWARYAYRAGRELWPDQPEKWVSAGRTAACRADEDGEHDEAIQIVTELLSHALDHGTPTEQASIRLDLADYLLNVGRCAAGISHARIAWTTIQHGEPPSGDRERFDRLLIGMRATLLLGGCHQHEDAVSIMFDALERYTGPDPADPDPLDPAIREQRWQTALAIYGERRQAHRAAHRHSPCDDEHHGENGAGSDEHLDQILALINARHHREERP